MSNLPESFLATMKELLGDEFEAFLEGYDHPRQYGLRVNTDKISVEQFERIAPFSLKKIPWISNGYSYAAEDMPARHPFYTAGLYYLQEPSAMSPASRLPINPGDRVLDLCAAPGGKATALGANLHGEGLLVANDINQARAKALLRNIELFGIANVFVTNEPPYRMAESFPEYFDKIMVDAPCSGEGMFRKNPAVVDAWLEKGPDYFSKLQRDIIVHAFDMLKPGGMMFYSTCTFSPLENEFVLTHLLEEREDASIIPMEDYEGFSEGLTEASGMSFHPTCKNARRIWPHKMQGEGHFMALIQKAGELVPNQENTFDVDSLEEKPKGKKGKKGKAGKVGKVGKNSRAIIDEGKLIEDFLEEYLSVEVCMQIKAHLEIRRDKVYYVPNPNFEGLGLHFLRNGVYLGDIKKNRFEPSEPFALSLTGNDFNNCINLKQEDERLQKYLRGESFDVSDALAQAKNGWVLLLVEGYPLGFAKLVNTVLKNKYPSGWRVR